MFVPFVFPSKNRLLVHIPTLIPELPYKTVKQELENKGFQFKKVNLIEIAKRQIGKPYTRGSKPLSNKAFDCSSLTQWLYSQLGVYIPRISIDQRDYGYSIPLQDIMPGDLIFTLGAINYYYHVSKDSVGHVGIFTGKSVIHAANRNRGVVEDSLNNFLKKGYAGSVRYVENTLKSDTLIIPAKIKVEYNMHLRWKILYWTNRQT